MKAFLNREVRGLVTLWVAAVVGFVLLYSCQQNSETEYKIPLFLLRFLSMAGPFFILVFWGVSLISLKKMEKTFKEWKKGCDPPSLVAISNHRRRRHRR